MYWRVEIGMWNSANWNVVCNTCGLCSLWEEGIYITCWWGVFFMGLHLWGCVSVCVCLLLRRQAGGGGGADMTNCQEECSGPLLSLSWYGHGVKLAHEGNKLF